MGHAALVGAAFDIVAARAACENLALVGLPMFGMRRAPAETHGFSTSRANRLIARAEGASWFGCSADIGTLRGGYRILKTLLSTCPHDGHAKVRASNPGLSGSMCDKVICDEHFGQSSRRVAPGIRDTCSASDIAPPSCHRREREWSLSHRRLAHGRCR